MPSTVCGRAPCSEHHTEDIPWRRANSAFSGPRALPLVKTWKGVRYLFSLSANSSKRGFS